MAKPKLQCYIDWGMKPETMSEYEEWEAIGEYLSTLGALCNGVLKGPTLTYIGKQFFAIQSLYLTLQDQLADTGLYDISSPYAEHCETCGF